MQPFHEGHRWLLSKIFKENQEVVICIGSAQEIRPDNPKSANNPLPADERKMRVNKFIQEKDFKKPYRIIFVADIDSDEEWPIYLAEKINIQKADKNNIYFGEAISEGYKNLLEKAGFSIRIVKRKKFKHKGPDEAIYEVGSATEIRQLYKRLDKYELI